MFMFWMRHGAYVYIYDGGLRSFWLVAQVMMFMNIWMSLSCTGGLPLDSPRFLKGIRVGHTSYVRIHLGFYRRIRVGLITHREIRLGFHVGVGAGPVNICIYAIAIFEIK